MRNHGSPMSAFVSSKGKLFFLSEKVLAFLSARACVAVPRCASRGESAPDALFLFGSGIEPIVRGFWVGLTEMPFRGLKIFRMNIFPRIAENGLERRFLCVLEGFGWFAMGVFMCGMCERLRSFSPISHSRTVYLIYLYILYTTRE